MTNTMTYKKINKHFWRVYIKDINSPYIVELIREGFIKEEGDLLFTITCKVMKNGIYERDSNSIIMINFSTGKYLSRKYNIKDENTKLSYLRENFVCLHKSVNNLSIENVNKKDIRYYLIDSVILNLVE